MWAQFSPFFLHFCTVATLARLPRHIQSDFALTGNTFVQDHYSRQPCGDRPPLTPNGAKFGELVFRKRRIFVENLRQCGHLAIFRQEKITRPIQSTFHSFCSEFHENSLQWIQNWKCEQIVTKWSTWHVHKYIVHMWIFMFHLYNILTELKNIIILIFIFMYKNKIIKNN
jgi:hypothetical protein